VSTIFDVFDCVIVLRLIKTGPTTVGVKLGVSYKQEGVAAATVIATLTLLIEQLSGVGTLSSSHAKHVILKLGELRFPLLIGFIDFVFH
jgi:hypothetical protein